jgi:hypothetical protein
MILYTFERKKKTSLNNQLNDYYLLEARDERIKRELKSTSMKIFISLIIYNKIIGLNIENINQFE